MAIVEPRIIGDEGDLEVKTDRDMIVLTRNGQSVGLTRSEWAKLRVFVFEVYPVEEGHLDSRYRNSPVI
jgi:hypothetical protein